MPRKIQQDTITFYMPEGYSEIIDAIVEQHHQSGRDHSATWKIKYCSIIDYIVGSHLTLGNNDFVNVNQKVSSKILGCDHGTTANLYRNLVGVGIIVPDRKMSIAQFHMENGKKVYTKEGKSYGFRIPEFRSKKITGVGIIVPAQKSETLKKNRRKVIVQNAVLKLYQECLNSVRIDTNNLSEIITEVLSNKVYKVDTELKYREYICKYVDCKISSIPYDGDLVPIELTPQKGTIMPTPLESDDKTIARIMRTVGIINSGEMTASRPVQNSRVYCDLSNMNRELRKAVRIDGKPIIGLDIRNSQPLLASFLFKKFYTDNDMPIPDDVMQYQADCEQGIFYDDFMKAINLPSEFRTEFKKDFFRQVFFSMLVEKTNPLKELFIKKYPGCWDVIIQEKGGFNFSRDYNKFAQRLQEIEALIIFDTVNIGLLKQGIKCYNNYDSLYVNNMEDYETAKALTIEAFNAVGINPTINPELYDCTTADNGVSEHQILDETGNEYEYKGEEKGEEIGYLKQLPKGINLDMITPFDNSSNHYGHLEPFKYFGCSVQTVKYYMDNCRLDEFDAKEFYNEQFRQIESMV